MSEGAKATVSVLNVGRKKRIIFKWVFLCKFGNSAWTPFLYLCARLPSAGSHSISQQQVDLSEDQLPAFLQLPLAWADAGLDCHCIHSSSDSLKPNSIQTIVFSRFCVNTIHFVQARQDTVVSIIPDR